jgi:hypothetical protein
MGSFMRQVFKVQKAACEEASRILREIDQRFDQGKGLIRHFTRNNSEAADLIMAFQKRVEAREIYRELVESYAVGLEKEVRRLLDEMLERSDWYRELNEENTRLEALLDQHGIEHEPEDEG